MPLTHKEEGEKQERETGAGNMIHLVFIWPSKTTPRSIAIQPRYRHARVCMCVCMCVCMSFPICIFPYKPVCIYGHESVAM